MKIAAVCGSFHKREIEAMLEYALDEAKKHSIEISEILWVPGSMEVPLALQRVITKYDGAICLGIIEKGETLHSSAMGNAVIKSVLDLQLSHNKPIVQQYTSYTDHIGFSISKNNIYVWKRNITSVSVNINTSKVECPIISRKI